jgi:NADH-quinone oxidoreductase subunit L
MVTAGVFMVCRLSPLFELSDTATAVVTYTGAATALFAATVGTTQWDIKRVIAYSTCSQLGFMFFAAGVGAYNAAMFHLFTHAFFKALLFLGAGSVIHAMHHEQDMRYYGGLRKAIPLTFWAMMAGTLAITGVGIYWLHAGFAGFHSKDAIIEAAYASGTTSGGIAFAVAVFAAFLTSFYSWRLMFLTFWGKPRWAQSEHIQHAVHAGHGYGEHGKDEHGQDEHSHDGHAMAHDEHAHTDTVHGDGTAGYHPHESPWSMLLPLCVLSIGAVFAGYVFTHSFLEGESFWAGSIAHDGHLMHAMHDVPLLVKLSATIVMILGLALAWWAYVKDTTIPARFVANFAPLHQFLFRKWYWDELYDLIFIRPSLWLGKLFWKGGDAGIIDRFGPNGAASVVALSSRLAGKLQTGYLYSYALVMLLGLAGLATWAMTR